MNKFTLKMEKPEHNSSIEVKFEEDCLEKVLLQVDLFLRGCGFVATGDQLKYVNHSDKTADNSDIIRFGDFHFQTVGLASLDSYTNNFSEISTFDFMYPQDFNSLASFNSGFNDFTITSDNTSITTISVDDFDKK